MKKQLIASLAAVFLLAITFLSCKDHDIPGTVQVFKVGQEPPGLSYPDLQRAQSRFVSKFAIEEGSATDPDGSRHSVDKQPLPDVMMLIGTFGEPAERSLVIPKERYVFLNLLAHTIWYYDDDPCDPDFHPAPGQDPVGFLKEYLPDIKALAMVSVVLDGNELVGNKADYFTSTGIFPVKVHKDFDNPDCDYSAKMAQTYEEGYSMLLKLPPGEHTLTVTGGTSATADSDAFESKVIWHLTVR